MNSLPFSNVRVVEYGQTLSARLLALLLADQGAEVLMTAVEDSLEVDINDYLNRNKYSLDADALSSIDDADVVIVDGMGDVACSDQAIVVRITAAIPGDEDYAYLPDDCSDDLLNGIVGFYTDMATTGKALGRETIYTPLSLCSIYAAVIGVNATVSALIQRLKTGKGQEIIVSRLAAGLAAIGALALRSEGLPQHLTPPDITGLPEGITDADKVRLITTARQSPAGQLELEQCLIPLAAPYHCADGRLFIPIAAVNRRLARRLCEHLGIWPHLQQEGMIDLNTYDPNNLKYQSVNIADPSKLNFKMRQLLCGSLREVFATKTSSQWFDELSALGIPCERVNSFAEWFHDEDANNARLIASVSGLDKKQLGRAVWLASAENYPELSACHPLKEKPQRRKDVTRFKAFDNDKAQALTGVTVVDFSNVIAGPNAGRMFAELGATVYKIDPTKPQHTPIVMTTWAAESGLGKSSMIIDPKQAESKAIINRLLMQADIVLANKRDHQLKALGLDSDSLAEINTKIIGLQLTGRAGEVTSPLRNHAGYDPSIQAATGIMERFGATDCPTFHGVASCVDYVCGYLAVFAGLSALYARECRQDGKGDWAETSLASAAGLVQCTLQHQALPESICGPDARGSSCHHRIYTVKDGYLFAEAPHDITEVLVEMNLKQALTFLQQQSILAAPVYSVKQLFDKHQGEPSKTIRVHYREKDGWKSEGFSPSWFCFDGQIIASLDAASRIGSDSKDILNMLDYSLEMIDALIAQGIIARAEWA